MPGPVYETSGSLLLFVYQTKIHAVQARRENPRESPPPRTSAKGKSQGGGGS